jgi:hypothetical protein
MAHGAKDFALPALWHAASRGSCATLFPLRYPPFEPENARKQSNQENGQNDIEHRHFPIAVSNISQRAVSAVSSPPRCTRARIVSEVIS